MSGGYFDEDAWAALPVDLQKSLKTRWPKVAIRLS
jgi:hypothetical protein